MAAATRRHRRRASGSSAAIADLRRHAGRSAHEPIDARRRCTRPRWRPGPRPRGGRAWPRARSLRGLRRAGAGGRPRAAAVRHRGVRRLPPLRRAGLRLHARSLSELRTRSAGGVLVQAQRGVLELRREAHERDGGAAVRSGGAACGGVESLRGGAGASGDTVGCRGRHGGRRSRRRATAPGERPRRALASRGRDCSGGCGAWMRRSRDGSWKAGVERRRPVVGRSAMAAGGRPRRSGRSGTSCAGCGSPRGCSEGAPGSDGAGRREEYDRRTQEYDGRTRRGDRSWCRSTTRAPTTGLVKASRGRWGCCESTMAHVQGAHIEHGRP